ncbi:hypothetical protein CPB83DRAFT_96733 [Crepidotus variabilis]|uniref:F-box domain-containing protein n=1 Tax=Crepidotus variabilis TaxID=179855 RepID=A0A9P6E507_9AGAR|nr:hypothetical protein CPB83DRAFT_96733 [Crepidotus variabilis]
MEISSDSQCIPHSPPQMCELNADNDKTNHLELDALPRREAVSKINARHDPMAHHLPVELSAMIFWQCLPALPPPESFNRADDGLDSQLAQITHSLTSVNQNWRNIACSTPTLWNSIFLNVKEDVLCQENFDSLLTNIKLRLQRSGSLPLNIRFRDQIDDIEDLDDIDLSLRQAIVEELCREAHRWQNICFVGLEKVLENIPKYTSELTVGAPQLSCLILEKTDELNYHRHRWSPTIGNFNAPSPSPSYLSLKISLLDADIFNFHRLTISHFHSPITSSTFLYILVNSPCLTTFTTRIGPTAKDNRPSLAQFNFPFRHTSLHTFDLKIGRRDIDDPFPKITLPNLENLKLTTSSFRCSGFHEFLCRSSSRLKNFDLTSFWDEENFISTLHLMPALEVLHSDTEISPRFFQHLGRTADRAAGFLPCLQAIHFTTHKFPEENFSWSLIRTMIPVEPTINHRPLSKVTVELHPELRLSEEEEIILKDLWESDIVIEVIVKY